MNVIAEFKLKQAPFKCVRVVDQKEYGIKQLNETDVIYLVVTHNQERLVRMISGWSMIITIDQNKNAEKPPTQAQKLEELRRRLVSIDAPPETGNSVASVLLALNGFALTFIQEQNYEVDNVET